MVPSPSSSIATLAIVAVIFVVVVVWQQLSYTTSRTRCSLMHCLAPIRRILAVVIVFGSFIVVFGATVTTLYCSHNPLRHRRQWYSCIDNRIEIDCYFHASMTFQPQILYACSSWLKQCQFVDNQSQ